MNIIVGGGMQNFMSRVSKNPCAQFAKSFDISGWEIRNISFPQDFSFKGWNLKNTRFVECDLPCDFEGAEYDGAELDCCTTISAKNFDEGRLAENRFPNPILAIAALSAQDFQSLPRRQSSPAKPWPQKLT